MTSEVIESRRASSHCGLAAANSHGTETAEGETVMTASTTAPEPARALSTVERYVEFWNATDADDQQRLAAATFADGVGYRTPLGVMQGAGELIGFRNQFAQQSPGYELRARTQPEAHHDRARLQWELLVGGESFATGTDVLEIDEAGRIVTITTFMDRAPEGFDPHGGH
jgi:hypothetical protein